jgi:ABC-type transport system involved in cytochrome c biogenesis ATPase subunit
MIDAQSLTRYYGNNKAVDDVSFAIGDRAIVGLLGHNGAGKTTVMKMLSGYLEPTAGQVHIDGRDLETHRREIQRRLGYLPESLPVYPEMTIADYLDYAASLKGLAGPDARRAIRRSIEATELGARLLDPIGNLSRGFRQRVGVAQAILGEPDAADSRRARQRPGPAAERTHAPADSRTRRIRHGDPVHAHHAGGGCALRPRAGAGQRPPGAGREHGHAARPAAGCCYAPPWRATRCTTCSGSCRRSPRSKPWGRRTARSSLP